MKKSEKKSVGGEMASGFMSGSGTKIFLLHIRGRSQ